MSCQRAKAEPRDERKELDGDRLDGDGDPSDPSSLRPSSSVPGSFPCCLWISLLMATSLYSWYRMAAEDSDGVKDCPSWSLRSSKTLGGTYSQAKSETSDLNWQRWESRQRPPLWISCAFCEGIGEVESTAAGSHLV